MQPGDTIFVTSWSQWWSNHDYMPATVLSVKSYPGGGIVSVSYRRPGAPMVVGMCCRVMTAAEFARVAYWRIAQGQAAA
ncbi:MAG: hypothetical protein HXY38_15035 [Chloroflexi bacterium]|nr:hypothetical protein [Chloroflexota bacterium]